MQIVSTNPVTDVQAEAPALSVVHFRARLTHETDCWDVHATQATGDPGYVLVDVRSPTAFANGHIPGAINIPRVALTARRLAEYGEDTLFVVYCAGPHCNGSTRAAIQIAELSRPVKEMIGGTCGWVDEGFELESA